MNKHLVTVVAAAALLVPSAAAQAAPAKSKVRFGATSFAVAENAGHGTLTVTRSARNGKSKSATNSTVSVGYSTSNGTAVAGTDYTAVSGRLTFPACGPSPAATDPCLAQTISVPVIDNTRTDGNRTVKVALTSPTRNAVVVNPQKATLTIADNEGPTQVTLDAASYSVWELGPVAEIHVIRSGSGISGSSGVDFSTVDGSATAPGDYTTTNTTLSYGPGEVDKTVLVPITDDSVAEPTESFTVALSNASVGTGYGAASSAPVTILDDDTPVNAHVGFDVTSYSVNEGGDVTITVDRTAGIDSPVSVDYGTLAQTAIPDADYTGVSDTLSFDPGDTSQSFTVSTLQDSLHEGDETFGVALYNQVPSGTVIDTANTTVTIADDDPVPAISAGSGSTDGSTITFPIVLTNPTTTDVTVVYVITDSAGNTVATGTATIPAGSTSTTVTVPVSGEGPYTITLSNPTGGTVDATGGGSATTTPPSDGSGSGTGDGSSSSSTETLSDLVLPPAPAAGAVTAGPSAAPSGSTAGAQTLLGARLGACGLTLKAASRLNGRRGLVVRLRAGKTCVVTLGASVRGTGGKHSKTTRVHALKTQRQTIKLAKGKARNVRLPFSKRALGFIRRALRAHRRMTLTLAVIERDARRHVSKRTTRSRLAA